jgi:hypothetical protein
MKQHEKVFSMRATEETRQLVDQIYRKMLTEHVADTGCPLSKCEAFGAIIKKLAVQEGIGI